jgi:AcrR family transcriptional regulator
MDKRGRLEKKDWMRAARLTLLEGGPSAVRVETLARKLRVSKGSFYWHFKNREALLESLLRERACFWTSWLSATRITRWPISSRNWNGAWC